MFKIKTILALLFIIFSYSLQAENIPTDTLKIEIDNAAPRLGEDIILSFDMKFLNDEIEKQLPKGVEIGNSSVFNLTNGELRKTVSFEKIGKYVLGPFSFEFNGKRIVTDSIEVNVAEALPFEEGVWVRYVETAAERYIIIEQLTKYTKTELGAAFGNKNEFVELIDNLALGLNTNRNHSSTSTKHKDGDILSPVFFYTFKKYVITTTEEFKGKFKLKEKHLKNLPKKIKVEMDDIEIDK